MTMVDTQVGDAGVSIKQRYYSQIHQFPHYIGESEHYNKAALSKIVNTSTPFKNTRQTDSLPLPPQEATTRPTAVSYDDNVRLLCNPDHCLWPVKCTIHNPKRQYSNTVPFTPKVYSMCAWPFALRTSARGSAPITNHT